MPYYKSNHTRGNSRSRGRSHRGSYRYSSNSFDGPRKSHGFNFKQSNSSYSYNQSPNNLNFLKNKIISILDNAFPKFLSLQDITNSIEIKHPKKEINQALYNLLHSKIAKRTDANPPKWTLLKKQEISSNLIDTNRQAAPNTSSASEAYSSLQQDFINKPLDPNVASFVSSQENAATSSANDDDDAMDYSDMPPLIDSAAIGSVKPESNPTEWSFVPPISSSSFFPPPPNNATAPANISKSSTLLSGLHESSAGDSIENKLVHYLSKSLATPLGEIVSHFKNQFNKKQINHTLYSLQDNGIASRSSTGPPVWVLTDKGKTEASSVMKFSFSSHSDVRGKRQESSDTIKRLESVTISKAADFAFEPPAKIPRMSTKNFFQDGLSQSNKNPISQLMEYVQANNLKIDFDTTTHGPDHKRRFLVVVTIDHVKYPPVEGTSKKDAKTRACEEVLKIIRQSAEIPESKLLPSVSETRLTTLPVNLGNSSKNAISLVNEYAQANNLKIEFSCDSCGPDHRRSFRTSLQIGDRFFQPVAAGSKKDSKLKAAEAALAVLQQSGKLVTSATAEACGQFEIRTFHDRVASMVNKKFHSLLADLPDTVVGRKILAGFVMSQTVKAESGEETQWMVISIGSGNRCVAGDKLSMKGDTVNDCHAEIIARRGLVRFLYQQLQSYQSDVQDEDNILIASSQDPSRLEIKPGIHFHLYISTAPCGDSALFAKSDLSNDIIIDPTSGEQKHHPLFENKKQGILRTKVENGEGCIPIDLDANVPTWDGLLRGERLRTMSCSDKLAKWNFVGLQGALLSHFLRPIYMSSLTLGMLFNHGHLTRAVCCRVEKCLDMLETKDVSPLYSVHHPDVAKVSGDDPSRDTGKIKTREYSLNWCFGDERAEVLDGTKGRCEARYGCPNPVSQVSKSSLYAEFKKVSKTTYPTYAKAKEAAFDYKNACAVMKEAFERAECGTWMSKPVEVENQF